MRNDEFKYLILSIVAEIPYGKIASYSQIAEISGYPKNVRQVGSILSHVIEEDEFPCHRVVHSNGELVKSWQEQAELLIAEGIEINNGKVDMKKNKWNQ